MQFLDVVHSRQSVRAYGKEKISHNQIEQILHAIRTAPSAGNYQSYEIYVVDDPERIARVVDATSDQPFVREAPVLLVFCSHSARCQYPNPEHWAVQDASIAATIALLAITDLGLGSCWVGAFDPARVASALNIPAEHLPLAILTVGVPAEKPAPTERRELPEFVHWVDHKEQ